LEVRSSSLGPTAGDGLFLISDNLVAKGSIVAYFPGTMYLREELVAANAGSGVLSKIKKILGADDDYDEEKTVLDYLSVDPHYNIQGRSDGLGVLDCRGFSKAGHEVSFSIDKSREQRQHLFHRNPLALGHFANHSVEEANVVAVPVDFPASGEEFPRELLRSFVCNSFFKPPSILGGKLEREEGMNGVLLVSCRDLQAGGEEIFVDYKIRPGPGRPEWY